MPAGENSRIGIMGGSFNPIHHGHLVAAQEAQCKFGLERVIFVPAFRNPMKAAEDSPKDMASGFHRLAMVELATSTNPDFYVSSYEIERGQPTFTIDTLKHFRNEFDTHTKLYFITGADAVLTMPDWHGIEKFSELCEVIAVSRPFYAPDIETFNKKIEPLALKVDFITVPALAISSSDIRERVRNGFPIRYLTPTQVAIYIQKHGLYKGGEEEVD